MDSKSLKLVRLVPRFCWVLLVSVLLSAHAERFSVSCMQDVFCQTKYFSFHINNMTLKYTQLKMQSITLNILVLGTYTMLQSCWGEIQSYFGQIQYFFGQIQSSSSSYSASSISWYLTFEYLHIHREWWDDLKIPNSVTTDRLTDQPTNQSTRRM